MGRSAPRGPAVGRCEATDDREVHPAGPGVGRRDRTRGHCRARVRMRQLTATIRDAWSKNSPEVRSIWNGSLPEFIWARRPASRLDGVPVFVYNLVEPAQLEADLDFLQINGYETLSAKHLVGYLAGEISLPERAVVLTFDDGPRDFHLSVFPLLKRFAARAVAFVAPGMHCEVDDPWVLKRPMSWDEMRQIHATGYVEFHSHTLESRSVANWPNVVPLSGCYPRIESYRRRAPRTLRDDLALSRQLLSDELLGASGDQLALPNYNGTAEAIRVVRSAGFRACYWGLLGGRPLNRPGHAAAYFISRMSHEFLRRLPGNGRMSLNELLGVRLRKVRAARQWRLECRKALRSRQ